MLPILWLSPKRSAVAGLTIAALSQVSLVSGLGSLLEPAIIGEPAVQNRRIGPKNNLQRAAAVVRRRRFLRRLAGRRAEIGLSVTGLRCAALPATTPSCNALRQNRSNSVARFGASNNRARFRSPIGPVWPSKRPAVRAPIAAVERRDQRLNDRHGAVVGAHVAPGFEIVRLGNMPVAQSAEVSSLYRRQLDGEVRLDEQTREVQIRRRVVHRIATDDDQQLNGIGRHIARQLAQRFGVVRRLRSTGSV